MIKAFVASVVIALGLVFSDVSAQTQPLFPNFIQLYNEQGPSVVSIYVESKITEDNPGPPAPSSTPPPKFPIKPDTTMGGGSGFIITQDGYIVTNAHVVKDAIKITVALSNKKKYTAALVGADKRTDVALIKISVTGLTPVRIGEASKLKVGEWVAAIGNPFGLDQTFTVGIVSAFGRGAYEVNLFKLIQSTVTINPGNSGGPLFNMAGEVVGINSMILSKSGGFSGVAFSIPIEDAMRVVAKLKADGKVTHGYIGVSLQEYPIESTNPVALVDLQGLRVMELDPAGPAARAGIKVDDIIIKSNGRIVTSSLEFIQTIMASAVRAKITLSVTRNGAPKTIIVTVG